MKINKKLLNIIWWISNVLLFIGGTMGIIYEFLPNKSIMPDNIFNVLFVSQFIILPLWFVITLIKEKIDNQR